MKIAILLSILLAAASPRAACPDPVDAADLDGTCYFTGSTQCNNGAAFGTLGWAGNSGAALLYVPDGNVQSVTGFVQRGPRGEGRMTGDASMFVGGELYVSLSLQVYSGAAAVPMTLLEWGLGNRYLKVEVFGPGHALHNQLRYTWSTPAGLSVTTAALTYGSGPVNDLNPGTPPIFGQGRWIFAVAINACGLRVIPAVPGDQSNLVPDPAGLSGLSLAGYGDLPSPVAGQPFLSFGNSSALGQPMDGYIDDFRIWHTIAPTPTPSPLAQAPCVLALPTATATPAANQLKQGDLAYAVEASSAIMGFDPVSETFYKVSLGQLPANVQDLSMNPSGNGEILAALWDSRVVRMDSKGNYLGDYATFPGLPGGANSINLARYFDGSMYSVSSNDFQLWRVPPGGGNASLLGTYPSSEYGEPVWVPWSNTLYCIEWSVGGLSKFNLSNTALAPAHTGSSTGLSAPEPAAYDGNRYIYFSQMFSSPYRSEIARFDTLTDTWSVILTNFGALSENGGGDLYVVRNLVIDRDGYLWASMNHATNKGLLKIDLSTHQPLKYILAPSSVGGIGFGTGTGWGSVVVNGILLPRNCNLTPTAVFTSGATMTHTWTPTPSQTPVTATMTSTPSQTPGAPAFSDTPSPTVTPSATPTAALTYEATRAPTPKHGPKDGECTVSPHPVIDKGFNIGFDAPGPCDVTIKIWNARGDAVSEVKDKVAQGGLQAVHVGSSNMAPGVYFYKVECRTQDGTVRKYKAGKFLRALK